MGPKMKAKEGEIESVTAMAVPLVELRPAPWNPQSITEERFQNLCDSIRADPDFLCRRPVLAQADGAIYAGNMRYRAAQHLGMKTVPALVEDVSDRLARERALRDNAQWGEWEEDELASLLARLGSEGSDLDIVGFDERDLQRLLDSIECPPALGDPDDLPALPDEPETRAGDLWLLGPHRLLCGDATSAGDVATVMADEQAVCLWKLTLRNDSAKSGKDKAVSNYVDGPQRAATPPMPAWRPTAVPPPVGLKRPTAVTPPVGLTPLVRVTPAMSSNRPTPAPGSPPPLPKRRVFLSYCHKDDQTWYDTLSAFSDWLVLFSDRSLGEPVRSDDPEYVNRRIREDRIVGGSVTIVLCGARTYGRRYVDWEIRSTLHHSHGLIGVALPSAPRNESGGIVVPARLHDNIETGYAVWMGDWSRDPEAWKRAIEDAYQRSQNTAFVIANDREKMAVNSA